MKGKRAEQVLWRSQYERKIREWLEAYGYSFEYESQQFQIVVPVPGVSCKECGSKAAERYTHYTPDFRFPDTKVVMEAKGKFDARARKIVVAMKEQHPDVDYRILLQRDNWLSGNKTQRYTDWLKKRNVPCHVGKHPPLDWVIRVPPGFSVPASEDSSKAAGCTSRGKKRRKS